MSDNIERVWRFTFTLNGSSYHAEVLALTEPQALARAARQVNHETGKSIEELMKGGHKRLAGTSVNTHEVPSMTLATARKKYGKSETNKIIEAAQGMARKRFEPYHVVMGGDNNITVVSLAQVPHFAANGYKVVGRWSKYVGGGQVV